MGVVPKNNNIVLHATFLAHKYGFLLLSAVRLTGLAPKALVVFAPKVVCAAPNAGVCCWVVLLPKGVAGRTGRENRKAGEMRETRVGRGGRGVKNIICM